MTITNQITMDLQRPGSTPIITATQDDCYSRGVEITLLSGKRPYPLPETAKILIRYRKFDGKSGEYDTLPDGTVAWEAKENVLKIALAPQMLAVPGSVDVSVVLISGTVQLGVCLFRLQVRSGARGPVEDSRDYFHVMGFLPAPDSGSEGQLLQIGAVDEKGNITALKAVDGQAGSADPEIVRQQVDSYLQENPPTAGADGITPHIGENGNWYLGETDTGKPSRGQAGADGTSGEDGVSPEAKVVQTDSGATVTITDKTGTTVAELKNGREGAVGRDGYTPVKGVDYWTADEKLEMETYIAAELAKRGQLAPEFVTKLAECSDTSRMYVLPDGYIYAYLYGESEAITYTNILDGTELHLNQRINSSGNYVALNGYVSTDYLKMVPGDVVRINLPLSNLGNAHDKNRGIAYNASKTIAYGNDGVMGYYSPVTEENGVCSTIFGQVYNTYGDTASGTRMITTISSEGYMRFNFWISDSAITEADVADLVVTLNEAISAGTVAGYAWRNTGLPFVPADYEDRIAAMEKKLSSSANPGTGITVSDSEVFAPAPQLPADGSEEADFDAENMTAQDIYDYFDTLCEKYPNYISKETLGKDASGTLDVNRYVLCRHYYKAWQRENYPKMYAWVNGSTVIYAKSVSPRIGDKMYSTAYIGTAYSTVTAVDNANQSRTVNDLIFTRDSAKDVEPTLVYTSIIGNSGGSTVYNGSQSSVTMVASISGNTMTGANGISYTRYPMGDRGRRMDRSTVVTIGANEHGFTPDPRIPAIVCGRLAKDLCECRNADNQFLNYLKNNVMLIVIPVINPYGFNLGTAAGYYNKNGVNINRNYDCPGWGNLDDTGTGAQGVYGGSEVETQYFMNTISEPMSDVAVSVHALGYSTNGGSVLCHYQGNNFNAGKIGAVAEIMAANYNLQFTDYGTTPPDTEQGGKSPAYITWAGTVGGLIEMQAEGAGDLRNTAYIMEANYTLLLQCIRMWISDSQE